MTFYNKNPKQEHNGNNRIFACFYLQNSIPQMKKGHLFMSDSI